MIMNNKIDVLKWLSSSVIGLLVSLLAVPLAWSDGLSQNEEKILNKLSAQHTLQVTRAIAKVVGGENGAGYDSVISGSKEERVLASYLAEQFTELGLEVRTEKFPVRAFEYGPVILKVGNTSFDAVTLHSGGGTWGSIDGISYTAGNSKKGHALTAPLIDAGDGLAKDYDSVGDVSGKVVLVRRGEAPGWPSYSITEAAERGAAAIIFYDYARVPLPDAIRQDSVWYRDMIPVLSISVNDATRIKAINKGKAQATIENRVDVSYGKSQNVLGIVRGSEFPDEWVIVSAHYDRWFNSDFDNNVGPAVVLEVARALTKGFKPRRSLLFIAYGSEESGTIDASYDWLAGSYAFVKDFPEISSHLVYAFNIDGAGMTAEKGLAVTTPGSMSFQQELINALDLQERMDVMPGPTANLDSWSMGAIAGGGVTNIMWNRPPEDNGVTYGSYYHTQFDVHDDSFYGNLGEDLRLATLGVMRAASATRVPLSLLDIHDWVASSLKSDIKRLSDAGFDAETVFTNAMLSNKHFRERILAVEASYKVAKTVDDIERLNRLMLKTRRELSPWLFEYREWASGVRTATPVNDLIALQNALTAVKSGNAAQAASALEGVETMSWGMHLSNEAYLKERLLWLEPTGWRSEFEHSPQQVSPTLHAYYLALRSGDTGQAIQEGLASLVKQANDNLDNAIFLVSGKLNQALTGKLRATK